MALSSSERLRTIALSDPQLECENIRFLTLYSPALRGRGDVSIFAPPGIDLLTSVPLVFLLHGVYDSHWAWFFKGGAHRVAAQMIAAGKMRPMLIVAPSDGLYQDGSGYLLHSGRDFEAWITEDVMEAVKRVFPCADGNSPAFISGLSMGGYGALRLGIKHAHIFRGISAHSAITHIDEMSQFVFVPFPAGEIEASDMDLLVWLEKKRDVLPPLRFDCGTSDPLLAGNRRFHAELERRTIAHQYFEYEGGHEWSYWRTHVASSFAFFEKILCNSL